MPIKTKTPTFDFLNVFALFKYTSYYFCHNDKAMTGQFDKMLLILTTPLASLIQILYSLLNFINNIGDKMAKIDVFGLGSALVDIQAQVSDEIIETTGHSKGGMALVDVSSRNHILDNLQNVKQNISSGGSVANTLVGITRLGGTATMAGCVGNDKYGKLYKDDIETSGVTFDSQASDGDTGTCVVLITPDAQRTMYTTLGCAPHIQASQVSSEAIANSKILYIEGYLWDSPETIAVVKNAMQLAKDHGVKVAFSASDSFCVSRHRDDFITILTDFADIYFANADEAKAISGCEDIENAITYMASKCPCVAITNGGEGSVIVADKQRYNIEAVPCKPVDTTGAGDSYAAGILYGIANGQDYNEMGKKAAQISSEVVSRLGARY